MVTRYKDINGKRDYFWRQAVLYLKATRVAIMESIGNVLGGTGQVGRIVNRNKNRVDSVTQAAMGIGPLRDKV